MDQKRILVACADDHEMMRKGIVAALAADEYIEVTLEANNGTEMLQRLHAAETLPDICIVDLSMPVMDGFELVSQLKQQYPTIKVLILTGFCHPSNIIRMINAGVNGYLAKNCHPKEITKAIYAIRESGYYFSEIAGEQTFKTFQTGNIRSANIPDSEMTFLKYCCTDLRYDQIAKEMNISTRTLDGYRERLFDRLGVNSRIALVVFAFQTGIITPPPFNPNSLKIKNQ